MKNSQGVFNPKKERFTEPLIKNMCEYEDMVKEYLHTATIIAIISVGLITLFYIIRAKTRSSL
jgi:hypothetical protein